MSALLLEAGVPEVALRASLFLFGAAGIVSAAGIIGVWLAGLVIDRRPRAGFVGALALAAVCTARAGHRSTSVISKE